MNRPNPFGNIYSPIGMCAIAIFGPRYCTLPAEKWECAEKKIQNNFDYSSLMDAAIQARWKFING